MSHPRTKITKVEVDTAACQHMQNDESTHYFGLMLEVSIDGIPRRLFLRTSEAAYPGNEPMVEILYNIVRKLEN